MCSGQDKIKFIRNVSNLGGGWVWYGYDVYEGMAGCKTPRRMRKKDKTRIRDDIIKK